MIAHFMAGRQKLVNLINDPPIDLFARLPNNHDNAINVIQWEIHTVSSHNAYHTDEIGIALHLLRVWYKAKRFA